MKDFYIQINQNHVIIQIQYNNMSFLFLLIVITCIFLAVFPTLFKLVFTYFLGFSKANIKLKHPFKYVRTFLELREPIWGIDLITIFIPEIRITINPKSFKICIVIDRPRVLFTRSNNQLLSLKIIDGIKENNLLYNLVTILNSIKNLNKTQKPVNVQNANNNNNTNANKTEHSRIGIGLKAILYFIVIIIVQFVEIKILNGQTAIISPMNISENDMPQTKEMRIYIAFIESFAEYLLLMREFNIKANLHDDHEINIAIDCPFLKLFTAQHMEDVLIRSQNLSVNIRIPFTFSFQKSMERFSVIISALKLTSQSTPVDFENLSKILNQFIFSQKIFSMGHPQQPRPQKKQQQQQMEEKKIKKKIVVSIEEAEVKMTELCEQGEDTPQALKYLSNISLAILKFQKVKLNEGDFTVNEVSLGVKKYMRKKQQQQKQKSLSKQVFKINNLLITKQQNATKISHDDVKISCQRQQLALLGKLFTLINSRVIIDEYDEMLYLPYVEIAKEYIEGKQTLVQTIQRIRSRKYQAVQSMMSTSEVRPLKHQSFLIYSPKQIQFQLDISELIHKIILYSSEYRQIRTLAGEINHELSFKRITMQYKSTKQFQVNDFKLFYRQAEAANQLELQVGDIHMIQNYDTLKDYFVGFTMFKLLLQFSSDQVEKDQVVKKSIKPGKKSLNFGKILFNYATELLTLRKLSIIKQTTSQGKLSSLYFSLAKCDFSVQRLYQTNKILKYYLSPSHNLISVASITIKQFLISTGNSGQPKQKYMINIKNPVILLPEIDISDRLLNYVKTFNRLQPSLEVFMNNTTDQQIRAKRRKYKIFMQDTDVYMIKITNFLIGIEDSVFDRSMLNRMRFWREYLQRKPKYNQSQTINYLKQTAQKYNLFQIQIQNISIDIKPLEQAGTNQKSVKQWISTLKSNYHEKQQKQQQTPRLIRVNNFCLQFDINDFTAKVRDYPFNLLSISKIDGNFGYLKTKNIYQETFHYLLSNIDIEEVKMQIGLSLLSGLGQVDRKLTKFRKSMDEYKNTEQFLHTLKTKSNIELSHYKPYWHILHKSTEWHISVNKQSDIRVKLMTGQTPYSKESLSLKMGSFGLKSNPNGTQLAIQYLQLTGNKLKIFEIGRQRINFRSIYNQPDLNLIIRLDIQSQNNTNNTKLKDNITRVSEQIIRQLWKIKQLRTDWLLIYGLVEPCSKKQENVLKRQQQSSYVELFKLAANNQLKNRDRELSIFSVMKQVKFFVHIDKFGLDLADQDNQIGFVVGSFNFSLSVEARAEKWKMRHFLVSVQNIIGRLKVFKKKVLALYENNDEFLTNFKKITDEDIKNRVQEKQAFKQIFLVCRDLKIRINEYALINDELMYLQRKFEIDSLKIQLTAELKKMLDSLFVSIFEANIEKVDNLTKNKYFKMSATQKLRETVVLVIRSNRKKKNFCEKLKMVVNIKNIQVGFKTPKKLLLLTNGKPTLIKQNKTFIEDDLYHVDPKISVESYFQDVEIWVSTHPNYLWLLGKGYSPSLLGYSERILKCSQISLIFEKHESQILPPHYRELIESERIERFTNLHLKIIQGSIQLTRSNIEVLRQIGEILINIVNSKQQKRKQWYSQKQKYEEMITTGRQAIKTKLSWKYSDFAKGSAPTLQSKIFCTLDKIHFTLFGVKNNQSSRDSKQDMHSNKTGKSLKQKYPFMKLVSSDIEMNIEIYSMESLKKYFKVNNLTIINCLQPEDSNFKVMLEMNHVGQLAVMVKIEECLMNATNPKVLWNFFKSIHVNLYPIKVKLTQQMYNEVYYFFFGIKPQTDERQQQLSNILPDYYLSVLIDEVKVQAWYRTPSRLKRLEGVSVGLEKYEMKNQFLDNKTLFDRWVNFVLKQLASQFMNVLSQKLFG